jgi:hypothetical protein
MYKKEKRTKILGSWFFFVALKMVLLLLEEMHLIVDEFFNEEKLELPISNPTN